MSIENDQPTTYMPAYGQVGPPPPPLPAPEPPKRKRRPKWVLPASLVVAGLIVGGGAGGAIGYGNKPEPVTIEKIVEKEVEVEVIKEVTPPSCIEALDVAQETIIHFSTFPDLAGQAVKATGDSNWAELNRVTEKIKTFNAELDILTPKMSASAPECRALAE